MFHTLQQGQRWCGIGNVLSTVPGSPPGSATWQIVVNRLIVYAYMDVYLCMYRHYRDNLNPNTFFSNRIWYHPCIRLWAFLRLGAIQFIYLEKGKLLCFLLTVILCVCLYFSTTNKGFIFFNSEEVFRWSSVVNLRRLCAFICLLKFKQVAFPSVSAELPGSQSPDCLHEYIQSASSLGKLRFIVWANTFITNTVWLLDFKKIKWKGGDCSFNPHELPQ